MPPQESLGPFCQSCGMPLSKSTDFGTNSEGYRINAYCINCYRDGTFTEPQITMQQMADKCGVIMAQENIMPADQARALLNEVLPKLERWRVSRDGAVRRGG